MIKLRFLGTGDGRECKVKRRLTKEFRRPASVLINDNILVDPSAEALSFIEEFGLSGLYSRLTDIVFTSLYPKSYSEEILKTLTKNGAVNIHVPLGFKINLDFYNASLIAETDKFEVFELGGAKAFFLPASTERQEDGGRDLSLALFADRALLYAPQGGWFDPDAWAVIRRLKFDAVVLDAAMADADMSEGYVYHNGLATLKPMRDILLSSSVISERTKVILTSLPTDKKRPIHAEISPVAQELSMTVAYDGYFLGI